MTADAPKTLAGAVKIAARWAELDGAVADIEERRTVLIGQANAEVDAEAAPLLKAREKAAARVIAWWHAEGRALAEDDKRKSIEIGGCMISERAGATSLGIAGDEDDAVAALQATSWAEPLLRSVVKLDRRAVLASIDGVYAGDLAKAGLRRVEGEPVVSLKRTAQAGSVTGAGRKGSGR